MNTGRYRYPALSVIIGMFLFALAASHSVLAAEAWQWKAEEGKSLALAQGDRVLWQFRYDGEQAKPYFHPVALPDGRVLTWNSPPDHPWHHALWFSWKYINGVNYWEPDASGRPAGQTEWNNVDIRTHDDGSARIAMDLSYGPSDDQVVMTERRVVEISPVAADGTYLMDWICRFTAGEQPVELNRTPLPGEPNGQAWGGYAGLSVRFADGFSERRATAPEGPIQFNAESRYRGNATGMDYNGLIDGKACGIAILDHPENLNHPTPWYVIRDNPMSYYSPAVICYGPHTLKPNDTFTLRYRVLVHDRRWDAEQLKAEVKRYVGNR